jgi:hypothetical protein
METATFVLRMVAHGLLENKELFVRHGFCVENTELSAGIFLEVMGGGGALSDAEFGALSESFVALIETEWPITTVFLTYSEAMERLQNQRSTFTHRLLSQKSERPVYDCFQMDKYICLKVGEQVMLPTTKLSALSEVGITLELVLTSNKSGVLLKIVGSAPAPLNDWTLKGLSVGNVWAESTGVTCCGDINRRIMENLVRLEELRFDEEVMGCAMSALRSHPDLKVILVSGPSASGKTTFASKLAVALRSLGKVLSSVPTTTTVTSLTQTTQGSTVSSTTRQMMPSACHSSRSTYPPYEGGGGGGTSRRHAGQQAQASREDGMPQG